MTYAQIYAAVQSAGVDVSQLVSIKQCITAREGEVWQYADWPLKHSTMLNLSVTGGTATVPLPTGMTWTTQGTAIFDNFGTELSFLEPREFYEIFQPITVGVAPATGYPWAWTLTSDISSGTAVTTQIRVGPAPAATATFGIRAGALPIKRTGATAWALGTMSADTDLPWWPDDYHFFLVSGAYAQMGKLNNLLDWQEHEQDFKDGMERLRRSIMDFERRPVEFWGQANDRTW